MDSEVAERGKGGVTIQIQDEFSGTPIKTLARLNLEIYDLIPNYLDRCPLCHGANCAVRHGLYRRQVVDRDGAVYQGFGVPRFRCRRRGPKVPQAVTFSVLPTALVPRRRMTLLLMVWIMKLLLKKRYTVRTLLDAITETHPQTAPLLSLDAPAIYQILHLFAQTALKLQLRPIVGIRLKPVPPDTRLRALQMLRALTRSTRGSPVVMMYHLQFFPETLFSPPR